jgi:hypothetical protein
LESNDTFKASNDQSRNLRGDMRSATLAVALIGAGLLLGTPAHGQTQYGYSADTDGFGVYINGTRFTENDILALQARLGIPPGAPVPPGRYWYDNVSGLWGLELRADASGGMTAVFVNGRALHPLEVQYLQQLFGYAMPGRYWLDWQGNLGAEGGPPLVNLPAAAQSGGGNVGGYGGYTRRTPFGGLGGDGNCSYYLHPDGPSVMSC